MLFQTKNPHYEHLRKKWTAKTIESSNKLTEKHGDVIRQLTLGSLGGLMLLTSPNLLHSNSIVTKVGDEQGITKEEDKNLRLVEALKGKVPKEVRRLDVAENEQISKIISDELALKVKSEIGGISLNRTYGMIGGEQHLYRYPGDNLLKHAESVTDWAMYGPAGIAPGLGAWGYFAPTEKEFSQKDKERERYYLAVQTFLAPGFAENVAKYRDFFKFRKMVVVNPQSGQSVVAVIGDAGPAEWTGKHLGGSPEVMHALGLAEGPRKGPVLYFFIDDPDDNVPLGGVSVKELKTHSL